MGALYRESITHINCICSFSTDLLNWFLFHVKYNRFHQSPHFLQRVLLWFYIYPASQIVKSSSKFPKVCSKLGNAQLLIMPNALSLKHCAFIKSCLLVQFIFITFPSESCAAFYVHWHFVCNQVIVCTH